MKLKAFTLVELMITFTAVAVIAAAFAPVVSKKNNGGKTKCFFCAVYNNITRGSF